MAENMRCSGLRDTQWAKGLGAQARGPGFRSLAPMEKAKSGHIQWFNERLCPKEIRWREIEDTQCPFHAFILAQMGACILTHLDTHIHMSLNSKKKKKAKKKKQKKSILHMPHLPYPFLYFCAPRGGTAASYSCFNFSFSRNLHADFCSDWTSLHSH